jgi:hypothetical protein
MGLLSYILDLFNAGMAVMFKTQAVVVLITLTVAIFSNTRAATSNTSTPGTYISIGDQDAQISNDFE